LWFWGWFVIGQTPYYTTVIYTVYIHTLGVCVYIYTHTFGGASHLVNGLYPQLYGISPLNYVWLVYGLWTTYQVGCTSNRRVSTEVHWKKLGMCVVRQKGGDSNQIWPKRKWLPSDKLTYPLVN
jgi:hypothetical protein